MTSMQEALIKAGLVRDPSGKAIAPGPNLKPPPAPRATSRKDEPLDKPPAKRRLGKADESCTREDKFQFPNRVDADIEATRLEKTYGLKTNSIFTYWCVAHRCYHIGGGVLESESGKAQWLKKKR